MVPGTGTLAGLEDPMIAASVGLGPVPATDAAVRLGLDPEKECFSTSSL